MKYSFGVPDWFIWIFHIIIGIGLVYIGYKSLNDEKLNQIESLILIIIGILAALYHTHISLYSK